MQHKHLPRPLRMCHWECFHLPAGSRRSIKSPNHLGCIEKKPVNHRVKTTKAQLVELLFFLSTTTLWGNLSINQLPTSAVGWHKNHGPNHPISSMEKAQEESRYIEYLLRQLWMLSLSFLPSRFDTVPKSLS